LKMFSEELKKSSVTDLDVLCGTRKIALVVILLFGVQSAHAIS